MGIEYGVIWGGATIVMVLLVLGVGLRLESRRMLTLSACPGRGVPSRPAYQQRQEGGRVEEIVQGFLYMSGYSTELDGSIVKIIGRVEASDEQVLENGPEFKIRFGDGLETEAFANELSPWYPT